MGLTSGVIEELKVLVLYPHSRCNCRCVMCDIWKTTEAEEISASELERHLTDIERLRVQWVVFSGGEPLMHSDLFRLAAMLRPRGIRTTLLSTGLLIRRHAEDIVRHIDDVIISLDGPAELHDQIRRIPGAFNALKAGVHQLKGIDPSFRFSVRTTVQKLNCSALQQTVSVARGLGAQSISFLAVDVGSMAFNRSSPLTVLKRDELTIGLSDLPKLEAEVEALIRSGDCGAFIAESEGKLRRIVKTFRARIGHYPATAPRCNAPWVSAVWEANGTVRPCFFQPPVGDLRSGGSLVEILNSPTAVDFRNTLDVKTNPICRNCVCSLYWQT
jgi:MoaA/NifB/PqqE/SkfB family radical SAM enzyme